MTKSKTDTNNIKVAFPNGWRQVKLCDVALIISGQHILESDHNINGQGIGYLTGPADFGPAKPTITRWTEKPRVVCEPADILVTVKGAGVGKINLAPDVTVAIGRQLMAIRVNSELVDKDFLFGFLITCLGYFQGKAVGATVPGLSREDLETLLIPLLPSIEHQHQFATRFKAQLAEVEKAHQAATAQLTETTHLANAIVCDSISRGKTEKYSLSDVLEEVKRGIGESWADFPVLGATRDGLAPAKEPPGKKPQRYKPVVPGTVFYNPMRILIGSIAFVDEDDCPGITSPDYVVLKGREGIVDSRWFYCWLRSSLGEQCISSLARGAVRERMLFNRLADGEIELPSFKDQQKASKALAKLKLIRQAIKQELNEINLLPQKILAQAFEI